MQCTCIYIPWVPVQAWEQQQAEVAVQVGLAVGPVAGHSKRSQSGGSTRPTVPGFGREFLPRLQPSEAEVEAAELPKLKNKRY